MPALSSDTSMDIGAPAYQRAYCSSPITAPVHRDPNAIDGGKGRRRAVNHVGRRIVQRQAGESGPVVRLRPGDPGYPAQIEDPKA